MDDFDLLWKAVIVFIIIWLVMATIKLDKLTQKLSDTEGEILYNCKEAVLSKKI